MYPSGAIFIALFNTINNTLNTLAFTIAAANPTYLSPYSIYIGAALYTIGILVETISEVQRKRFKDKPENKGKAYAGGLFSLARNINYGGYTLWRSGMALAAGGPIWGSLVFAFFTWDFSTRAIPVLEEYCRNKYGEQYKRIEKEVPYRLFPGIY
jgi:steroid 5-alpha reductase family enzyme